MFIFSFVACLPVEATGCAYWGRIVLINQDNTDNIQGNTENALEFHPPQRPADTYR